MSEKQKRHVAKSKKTTAKSSTPESSKELEQKQNLEKQIRHRVACEEKAFRIVEKMLENPITEEFLLESALSIQPTHYQDIVEERAIAMMCGYPICQQSLVSVPKQKYHISTRSNKVYDITARKNFCSNKCFHASEHFEKQLSTSPLWTRGEEPQPVIQLLQLDTTRGVAGHEVISGAVAIKKELEDLQKLDRYEDRLRAKQSKNSDPDSLNLQALQISSKSKDSSLLKDSSQLKTDLSNNSQSNCIIDSESENNSSQSGNRTQVTEGHNKVIGDKDPVNPHSEYAEVDFKSCDATANQLESTMDRSDNSKSHEQLMFGDHYEHDKSDSMGPDNSSSTASSDDKMKLLMKLLDRRKHLLGKMANIQQISGTSAGSSTAADHVSHLKAECLVAEVPELTDGDKGLNSSSGFNNRLNRLDDDQSVNIHRDRETEIVSDTAKVSKHAKLETKRQPHIPTSQLLTCTPLTLICRTMKQWVTKETLQYLLPENEITRSTDIVEKHKFEEKYQELCRKLDTQENDLENMLDETSMEDANHAGKPLPDYQRLKQDTEEFGQKVAHYFQGKTHTQNTIREKEESEKSQVYLPTVDTYDQMLIRRKIVMDKLNKMMPELLPPLKLSIQDIFSDIKQLLQTFSFTSHNILFKPAEWTLVSLVLLKMLSRKQLRIAASFLHTSAESYFSILLQSIGETTHSLDLQIDFLMNI